MTCPDCGSLRTRSLSRNWADHPDCQYQCCKCEECDCHWCLYDDGRADHIYKPGLREKVLAGRQIDKILGRDVR